MKTILFLGSIIACFFSCNSDCIRDLTDTQVHILEINNSDEGAIGYLHYEGDMDLGVNTIIANNSIVYFTDPFHENIKSYDLNTNELRSSNELAPWITDVYVNDRTLYIVSEYDGLFVLNSDLNVESKIALPKGHKYFIDYQGDIYLTNTSAFERTKDSITYDCYSMASILDGDIEASRISFKSTPHKVGYYNIEEDIDNQLYLLANGCYYEIPHSLNDMKEYDANNTYVEERRIVHFFTDDKNFKLEVFEY